jgi:hypothetical protein
MDAYIMATAGEALRRKTERILEIEAALLRRFETIDAIREMRDSEPPDRKRARNRYRHARY